MSEGTIEQKNAMLDEIILRRRTCRMFKDDHVPDEKITEIIHAGLHAPYAAAAIGGGGDYFRRFFVIRKNSLTMKAIQPLVFDAAMKQLSELNDAITRNEGLRAEAAGFCTRLAMIKKLGFVPGVGTAPFYLVIAEKRGFPAVEQESLAHCLENMWLKATALDLGFELVSITALMADNEAFCTILGLKSGAWGFMGCAIGHPSEKIPDSVRPAVSEVTTWLP